MTGQLGNVIFIIWRECVEALLVIGILNAWLSQNNETMSAGRGRRYLWAGVGAGVVLSLIFAFILVRVGDQLDDTTQQIYQAATVLIAAGLIVQMVFWMRRHGRTLKRELESALSDAAAQENWWSVFVLALIAVAREGSETVVFIYGAISASPSEHFMQTSAAIALGFALALASYWLLQMGTRFMSWRLFFKITEIMLLLLAGALLIRGVENLIDLEVLPPMSARLWDTSFVLPDVGIFGGLMSSLTGYRAKPYLMEVLTLLLYWGGMLFMMREKRR